MRIPSCFCLWLLVHTLCAQNGEWTYLAPAPDITCLAAQGNTILAGSDGGGIVRFDTSGNRSLINTANANLPSDTLKMLAIDQHGHWWMHHEAVISRYDGANTETWSAEQMGLPAASAIRALKAAPDSSVYVATDNGLAIFKNGAWSVLNMSNSGLTSNNIWDVAFGADGKRYFATFATGVVIQDGANWTSYNSTNIGITFLNNIYSLAVTADGVLWMLGGQNATLLLRLAKFEAGVWTNYAPNALGITPTVFFRDLSVDNNGRLYLLTNKTISNYDAGTWSHQYSFEDIGCSSIGTVAPVFDGANRLWAQTSCQIARFDGQRWTKPGTGLPGAPLGYFWDGLAQGADNSIWMGTYEGEFIARFKENDQTWEQYYPRDWGASTNHVYSIQPTPDGDMWIGLDRAELLHYDANGNWTFFDTCTTQFPGHYVLTSATAPNGDQWFSFVVIQNAPFPCGMAQYTASGEWHFFSKNNAPLPDFFYARKIVFDSEGTAWFATTNSGLFGYDGIDWEILNSSNSGLPNNNVAYLGVAPDEAVWAAINGGLARYENQSLTFVNTSNSDIPSSQVYRVDFDQAGGMYIGYAPEPPNTPGARTAVFRNGEWTELVPPGWENTFNDAPDAFMVDRQNRLWFVENVGFGVYRYDPMLVNDSEPSMTQLSASPNPTSGAILLQLETPLSETSQLEVWNTVGQIVQQHELPASSETTIPVDLSRLASGVYWVRLQPGGGVVHVVKVVKQ